MSTVLNQSGELTLEEKRVLLAQLLREKAKRASSAPLSFAQQRLWFLDQLEPGNAFYNMPQSTRIGGELSVQILHQAFDTIVMRHESLRTTFGYRDGTPVQIINKSVEVQLPVVDLSELPAGEREKEARRLASEEARRPFDLGKGPLLRASLLRLGEEDHVLLLTMHHIVSDGWSAGILMRELSLLYEAYSAGKASPLAELPIQYADFAVWQREWLQGEVLEKQLSYWRERLGDDLPVLELPTDRVRPAVQSYRGNSHSLVLSKNLADQLRQLSQQEGATLYMVVLAAFQVLLSRYSGQEDIIVGSPIAGRNRAETEGLIGFFVNTLVVRTDLTGNPTFRDLLKRVKEVALDAYAHQDLPFEKLVEELQPERDLSQNPLFQVMFALQNAPRSGLELGELKLSSFSFENKTTRFDLEVHIWELGNGSLRCSFVYNTDLFEERTVEGMARHYQTLLESIVAEPGREIQELRLLTRAEEEQLVVTWNETVTEYPRAKSIGELFEAQVEASPDEVAVVYEDRQLTYRELNERANQVGRYLQKLGVGPEVMVAISVERSLEMVVGLLGIIKAGGAYVPLDPEYPAERLRFMMGDTRAPVLITQERQLASVPASEAQVVCLDRDWEEIKGESGENLAARAGGETLAYVMYTSGSSGRPKGVTVRHRSVVRLVRETNYASFTRDEVFLQFAPLSFDASTLEVWGALLNGGRLAVMRAGIPSLEELGRAIREYGVTTLWLTAGLFHQMVESELESLSGVRQLLAGGDVLSVNQVEKVLRELPECRLINGYGPTENTTFTCCYGMGAGTEIGTSVPIGRPISNTQVYILDQRQQPVPAGVAGELYIGGDGLARGYLNRPELTEEKFVANPFKAAAGARLYRTGDRVRYLADGNIEFLGRIDQQVKIRGYRIELGEIEAVLSEHPAIKESVVIARQEDSGDKRLVAYLVVGDRSTAGVSELRSHLKQKLPDYMVPSTFVILDELPLTPNGKVDRHRLPAPEQSRPELEEGFVAPRDELERQLSNLWERILDVKPIGVTDNFFELGGHSLLAVRLFAQIEKLFHKNLPLATLFQAPTIEGLAEILRQEGWVSSWSSLVPIKPGGVKPPFYLVHPSGGNVLCYRALARFLDSDQPVFALQAQGLDGKRPPHATLEEMATHYIEEIRTLQPEGPYHLGGSSSGGVLAFEIAQQLQAQGEEVGLLAMIDTFFPGFPRFMPNRALFNFKLHRMMMRADLHLGHLLILRPKEQVKYILDGLRRIKKNLKKKIATRFRSEDALRQTIERVRQVNSHAFKVYKPKNYSGRITYFWCTEMMFRSYVDNRLGWDAVAESGLEVHMVPGSHTGLLDIEPHTRILAEELNKCLQKIQAAVPNDLAAESTKEGAHTKADQHHNRQKVAEITVR
jgi:aspartate racemase